MTEEEGAEVDAMEGIAGLEVAVAGFLLADRFLPSPQAQQLLVAYQTQSHSESEVRRLLRQRSINEFVLCPQENYSIKSCSKSDSPQEDEYNFYFTLEAWRTRTRLELVISSLWFVEALLHLHNSVLVQAESEYYTQPCLFSTGT